MGVTEIKLTEIKGGICAPAGFSAAGIHCGLRKGKGKYDLALIAADRVCDAAAVYTQNIVQGAPITVTKKNLADGRAQAVVCNSGIANTCNPDGLEKAGAMCAILAEALHIAPEDVIVASTGVIGMPLPIEPLRSGIPAAAANLGSDERHAHDAAIAIMTTDTKKKELAVNFELCDGTRVNIGAIAKGSGMIAPNMATMLCFMTTDIAMSAEMLHSALTGACGDTFNMVSIDGDTSTNDMLSIMAGGRAGNSRIIARDADYARFYAALEYVSRRVSVMLASDGEGATKLIECAVHGFADRDGAKRLARSVIGSSLVKTAMFGADANWGRELCALGYAGVDFDPLKIDLCFIGGGERILVCKNGGNVPVDEDLAKKILSNQHVIIDIDMGMGGGPESTATAYGCDLSYEYVRINGDYRS